MRKKSYLRFALLVILALSTALANLPIASASAAMGGGTNAAFWNEGTTVGGDPNVLYDKESGYYYLYSSVGNKTGYYFGIYRSADLVTWEQMNGGIPYRENNAGGDPVDPNIWGAAWFWAPECYYNENNGWYYLIYTARPTSQADILKYFDVYPFDEACMGGVAVSRKPEGPFYNITNKPVDYRPYDPDYYDVNQIMPNQNWPPQTQEEAATAPKGVYLPFIDVHMLFDDDGKIYYYYSRNAYRNWVWDDDLEKFIEESNIYVVPLTSDWWYNSPEPVMPTIDPAYKDCNRVPGDDSPVDRDGFIPVINYGMQKQSWENGHVNDFVAYNGARKNRRWAEGPDVRKISYEDAETGETKSKYYLIYSCNNVDYLGTTDEGYGEGYATSDSPLGPFQKGENNPLLKRTRNPEGEINLNAPGHGCFIDSPDGTEMYHVHHGRVNPTASQRYLYTNKFVLDYENRNPDGSPQLKVDVQTGDQPIPSGVAPYKMNLSCSPQAGDAKRFDVSFEVTNKDGGPLYLASVANRVNVAISDPSAAVYTAKDKYSGTLEVLTDDEVTVSFTYQRQSVSRDYYDVFNDALNASSIVQRRVTFNAPEYAVSGGQTITVPIRIKDCQNFAGVSAAIQYDESLLTLESITQKTGFFGTVSGNKFLALTSDGSGVNGDAVIGYAIFSAKTGLPDDVRTYITFDVISAYDSSLDSIALNLPDIPVTINRRPPLKGDVSLDGEVELRDIILLLQHLAGNTDLSARQLEAADVNGDGYVSVSDAVLIMQMCIAK